MATPTSSPERPDDAADSSGPLSAEFLATISHGPGVYQMLGRTQVLYVGKARDLRKRLAQYAHYSGPAHSKTAVMLSRVHRVETILTTTEKEALILEASLIKQHRPRYNVILRDDKNYPLIKVTTREEWPRVVVTRRRLRDGNRYFGPYASSTAMRSTLQMLYNQFPLRRCKTVRERSRPCLNFQMGRCLAPCAGRVDAADYQRMVRDVLLILEGRTDEVVGELTAKMEQAAEALRFEQAAGYRDLIRALARTTEHQAIVADHHLDQDVFGIHRQDASVGIALLFVRGGMITGAQTFFLAEPLGEDDSLLSQTILQYYSAERQPPRELLLPLALEDADLLDGGKGQLQVAVAAVARAGLTGRIDLVAIAKEKAEEGEKLFRPGRKNPILLPAHSPVLLFLMRIRDEAHRFGITFHRRLRGREQLTSRLDAIDGIGPKRKQQLLRTLGSLRKVMEADLETLAAVDGIGPELARQIHTSLHGDEHGAG